ncbi:MAG: hypothetical protein A2X28_01215 [Elusimicrobia bacterium GWA2_56_46]|nr:MAG: hypothetical protein A2X28_01215 [Elusimicrobia bacterium GWA2_56_46]OGR53975.1 MAG: hypothetical protein A2X39_09755 [Elusimicrobia bacterium GWC2_56_31]HBB65777.1 hypothetical protein [Elusimicrobiota bacterium]HBW22083.1 hypothetical protein [Elusimicrobiota bacterium]
MKQRHVFIVLVLCLVFDSSRAGAESARINKISFSGNRVSENVLRSAIPIKGGSELTQRALEDTYAALYSMKLFKSVEISTVSAGEGLADVRITAEDGWYLLPFPFAFSGPAGASAGLFLVSRNIFRRAETISVSGATAGTGGSASVFFEKNEHFVRFFHSELDAGECRYADGAYSPERGTRKPGDAGEFLKYGAIAALYGRRRQTNSLSVGFPLWRRGGRTALSAALGYTGEKNTYDDGLRAFHGGGRTGSVSLGLKAGGAGEKRDDLGVIFGLGLADLDKRLQRRTKAENRWGAGLTVSNGGAWTGADYAFSKAALSLENSTVWGRGSRFSLRCAAAFSANAPESQLFATGREMGLMGQYAREFRAQRMTSLGALFSKPIYASRRGILQASVFAEAAFDPADYPATAQKGAGISLYYRFWRFPLPLGLSQTYSFRDRNAQLSAAIGGRF